MQMYSLEAVLRLLQLLPEPNVKSRKAAHQNEDKNRYINILPCESLKINLDKSGKTIIFANVFNVLLPYFYLCHGVNGTEG